MPDPDRSIGGLEQYLVPVSSRANELCFTCRRACGGCSWSEIDPATDKPRFEPVPGWTAEPVKIYLGRFHDGQKRISTTWHITACPLYSPDRDYEPPKSPPPPPKRPAFSPQPVEKVDADGKVVAEYPSARAAARANHVNDSSILDWCRGKIKNPRVSKGFNYRFKKEVEP